MAKWKLNAMAESVRNKIGNLVFWPLSGGRVVSRNRVIPYNPNSAAQAAARSILGYGSQVWESCDASEQSAWNALASTYYTRTDLDGNTVQMSGRTLCTLHNINLLTAGESTTTTAPSGPPPGQITSALTLDYDVTGGLVTITFDDVAGDEAYFRLMVAPSLDGGRKIFTQSDFVIPTTDTADSVIDSTPTGSIHTVTIDVTDLRSDIQAALLANATAGTTVQVAVYKMANADYCPQIQPFGVGIGENITPTLTP